MEIGEEEFYKGEGYRYPPQPSSVGPITQPYEDLLYRVMCDGTDKPNRTGINTRSIFGAQIRYDLNNQFPLITSKSVHFRSIAYELMWFLRGYTNNYWLKNNGVTIWDEWAYPENGELGPIYGHQWRNWGSDQKSGQVAATGVRMGIDQITEAIRLLRSDPNSRRNIVSAWNVGELHNMAMPPCHIMFQLYVENHRLSLQVYQRSADMFLGVPFNLASYALLARIFAHQCDLQVGELIWTGGDCHIYENHFEQVMEQLDRAKREPRLLPKLNITKQPPGKRGGYWDMDFDQYKFEDFVLIDYRPHPAIKADVAI